MYIQIQPEFDDLLQPLGNAAAEFFLAASLYHARKISLASAAHMTRLDFESFKTVKVVLNTSPIIFLGKIDCLKVLTYHAQGARLKIRGIKNTVKVCA